MSKNQIAISFLKTAGTGQIREAYEKYVGSDFIHHNQYFKGDRQSLMNAMEEAHKNSPNKSIEAKQSFEDGSFVVTHSLVTRQNPEARPIAAVHIFRIEGEKIVELWDVVQEIIKDSPNQNCPF